MALIGPLLVEREIDASNSAVAEGNQASAVSDAEAARSIEPWATSPYKQLGLLAELEGNYPSAVAWLDKAIEREEESWLLYYLRARVEHEAGDEAAATASRAKRSGLTPKKSASTKGSRSANEQGLSHRARARGGHARPEGSGEARSAPAAAGAPPEPSPGARESRRRGALLRRLLALGDWTALIASLFVVTAMSARTDCRDAFLGDAVQPDLDPRLQAPRPLRQRPPADPPQHPRRDALAGLGQRW